MSFVISTIYHTLISYPLYNGLILLVKIFPFLDAGMLVIVFTVIIKLILLPLSVKASRSQIEMKTHEKALNVIKEKYKDNKEEQAKQTMEYYKEHGVNPLAPILIILIQLPIIIGLYRVFIYYGLSTINTSLLYSFISPPAGLNMIFLGLVNVTQKSLILAILAGVTAYFQTSIATSTQKPDPSATGMQADLARSMTNSMKYFFPVLMVVIAYKISVVVSLYLITSNLFAIAQELYIRKKYHQKVFVE